MNKTRQKMLDEMIKIYGFEHEITISFAKMLEEWKDTEECNKALEILLKAHKEYPVIE